MFSAAAYLEDYFATVVALVCLGRCTSIGALITRAGWGQGKKTFMLLSNARPCSCAEFASESAPFGWHKASSARISLEATAPVLKPQVARKRRPGGWHCLSRGCCRPYSFPGGLDKSITVFSYRIEGVEKRVDS